MSCGKTWNTTAGFGGIPLVLCCQYFLWFAIYSLAGWIYESLLCSVRERKWINRGFLNGPYCPIYGAGAVLDLVLLGNIRNPVVLFFAGMLVTGILEYLTSWLLETLFHARWWDYRYLRFQIHGRVCLLGGLVFGTMTVVLIYGIHPWTARMTAKIPPFLLIGISTLLMIGLLIDVTFTVIHLNSFNKKLRQAYQKAEYLADELAYRADYMKIRVEQFRARKSRKLSEQAKTLLQRLTWHERKILRSFPQFQSTRYSEVVERLKEAFRNHR